MKPKAENPNSHYPADFRGSDLYVEAESLFQKVLRPGCGRPGGAVELTVSPDGQSVAFTGSMLEKLDGVPATRICIAGLDSGDIRIVSFGPNTDLSPRFSPNGSTLAFRSDRASQGNYQVYFLDLDTGVTTAAPVAPGWVEYFEFSPDGSRLLMGIAAHGADVAGGQGAKTSKKRDSAEAPSWMPTVDANDTASRRRSVWVLELCTGQLTCVSPESLNVWEANWCGNDGLSAIVSKGVEEEHWYTAHLVHLALGGSVRQIYTPNDQLEWLSGTPDGRHLAFVEAVCSDRWIVAGDLRVVECMSGKVRQIPTNNVDVTFTQWRDDQSLVVAGVRDFETVIGEWNVDTGAFKEIWASKELYCQNFFYPAAALRPGSADVVICATGHTTSAHLLHITREAARKIVDFGHEGIDEVLAKFRKVEPYRWKAPDGREMHGWLMRGAGQEPAPLVMEVHGGPIWRWTQFPLTRSAYYAMLAERGYAIFWPNPRGSSGRGQDFARLVVGDMGGADTQDYLSGLDQLIAEGVADPKRIGVTGGSYGGFMSSWLITQDQRFAAAVPLAPVTNWVSQHLTSNIPYFDTMCLGSDFTQAGGNHHSRSPVMFAHRVKTPTLNICGALDRCTPPGQAQEFHNALLSNGVRSVLVTYPFEGHGVRTFPAVIDYAARVVDWFLRHMPPELQPGGD